MNMIVLNRWLAHMSIVYTKEWRLQMKSNLFGKHNTSAGATRQAGGYATRQAGGYNAR